MELKKIAFSSILILFGCLLTFAQSPAEKISEIKRQGDKYWYAESTGADEKATLDKARLLLTDVVRSQLTQDKEPEELLAKAQGIVSGAQHIVASRGPLKRVFVYVEKKTGDKPKTVVAAQILESPAVSEVKTQTVETPAVETPAEENNDAVVIELGNPKSETTNAEEIKKQSSLVVVNDVENDESLNISDFEHEILNVSTASGIEKFLKSKKADGEISGFGRLKTMPSSGDLYLFIFNPAGEIEAYLRRKNGEINRIDDNSSCAIADFKGCGAIWFKR